jgi:hypothetical protein
LMTFASLRAGAPPHQGAPLPKRPLTPGLGRPALERGISRDRASPSA